MSDRRWKFEYVAILTHELSCQLTFGALGITKYNVRPSLAHVDECQLNWKEGASSN